LLSLLADKFEASDQRNMQIPKANKTNGIAKNRCFSFPVKTPKIAIIKQRIPTAIASPLPLNSRVI